MRISTDHNDPAYIDDRPRRVWCNDVEIEGWTVADEFRRCVITPTKVHNGSVRIERLPRFVRCAEEDSQELAGWLDYEVGGDGVPCLWMGPPGTDPNVTGGSLSDHHAAGAAVAPAPPIHAGFSGVFVNDKPPITPAPTQAPKAPAAKKTRAKRRR